MNIWEIYKSVQFSLNKSQRGNAFSIEEFNTILPLVSTSYFKQKVGLPEEWSPRMPISRQAWANAQKITDDLRLVVVNMGTDTPPLYINKHGFADLPEDYIHQDSAYSDFGDVEFLNSDDFTGRLFKTLKGPTMKHAICRNIGQRLQFAPKELSSVKFSYLRLPQAGYLDFIVDQDQEKYLPQGQLHDGTNEEMVAGTFSRTIQPEWPEQTHTDLVNLLISMGARNLRDGAMSQISESVKQRGI